MARYRPLGPAPGRRDVLGGLALTALGSSTASAAALAGVVDALRGSGFAIAAAAQRPLALASEVFIGDFVGTQTESAMGLRLGRATQVRLGAGARLRIDRFMLDIGGVLMLESGGLLVDHNAPAGAPAGVPAGRSSLDVRSPFGLIAVRGTRFFAGPSNGVFGVFVQRGAVSVSNGDKAVQVLAGMGTNIASPGAEPTDPVAWGNARIVAALASAGADL